MSIATSTALIIAATVAAAGATAQNMNAIKARQDAKGAQNDALRAAEIAANKSKAATTTSAGDVSLQSEEDLQDEAIRGKSTKNRLRVDKTGLSLGAAPTAPSSTGLKI